MAKQSGFIVTIKAFIPAPKNDFKAQAAAAQLAADLDESKTISEDFIKAATVIDLSVRTGGHDTEEPAAAA